MPNLFDQSSLADVISRAAEGKGGGGQGAPQAFGQADSQAPGADPAAQQGQEGVDPNVFLAGANELDPISQYELAQRNLGTAGHFAKLGGISTSLPIALRGNALWAQAANFQRYLDQLRLEAELGRLGIGTPGQPSAYERAKREQEEADKKKTTTPGIYNPNPASNAPTEAAPKEATPASPPAGGQGNASWMMPRF